MEGLTQELLDALPEAAALATSSGELLAANARFASDVAPGLGPSLLDRVDDPRALLDVLRLASRTRGRSLATVCLRGSDLRRFRCEAALVRPRRAQREPPLVLIRLVPHESAVSRFVELSHRVRELDREMGRRQRVEGELRQERRWLEVTLTSIGDAVLATDVRGAVVFMNPVAEKLTGWMQDEAIGRSAAEVFHIVDENRRAPAASPIERVIAEGLVVGLANHTLLIRRDGEVTSIDDSAAPIRDRDGRVQGVVLVFHDVTEQRSMARELQARAEALAEAGRRKDEFLSMLAHELRNPLAAMLSALELLRTVDDPRHLEWSRDVLDRQVRHMARLVDDLLDVSRIARGTLQMQIEPVDLAAIVARAIESGRAFLSEHQLALDLPSEPIPALADAVRVEQVLMNLLHNATKFSPSGGRIDVALRRRGAEAELVVRDTGSGIAADELEALFEPFVQGDRSLARARGGLGIGLTLVRDVVRQHGGAVSAHSDGPGTGATFTVRLPVSASARPVAEAPASEPAKTALSARVMVVDDNDDAATSLALLLRAAGYDVAVAPSGPEALELARGFAPRAALLDIGLPGLDGYELARRLRREHPRELVLVALTGYGTAEDRRLSADAGFDAHVVKPVDHRAVLKLLAARLASEPA